MSFLERIRSKTFLRQFLFSIGLTLVLLVVVFQLLGLYTHHGEEVTVPNFAGLKAGQLTQDQQGDLETIVVDSIFDLKKEKGTIISQEPLAGSKVKRHRKIYLTVIATMPEKVSMPDLTDLTLRQATAMLETYGLQVNNLQYVPDIAKNAVLKQKYKGQAVAPGTMLQKGSRIDLVLGNGLGQDRVEVPFLLGLSRREASGLLSDNSLNLGAEIYEDGKDTLHARIYKQRPSPGHGRTLSQGQTVDVWYKSEEKFDFDEYIQDYRRDSLNYDQQ